jgi:tetratricopeptide (TPR) repeat protein
MHFVSNRLGAGLSVVCAVVLPLAIVPAAAEDDLSNRLTDQILQLQKLDLNGQIKGELNQQNQTVERANKLRELLKKRATNYEQFDEIDRAEADFNAMVEIRPQNPIVFSERGYFYMRQSRFSEAVRDFTAGAKMAPKQAAYNYGAGRAFARMGAYADAIEQYTEAMRLAPQDGIAPLSRAEVYVQLAKYAEARADYDLALALGTAREADRFFVLFGRGYVNVLLGDYAGAVRAMDAALAIKPKMVNAVVWRGYARERMGQRDRALDDYEAALQISPRDEWIRASIRRVRS